jgi:hypothetical protein
MHDDCIYFDVIFLVELARLKKTDVRAWGGKGYYTQ